MPSQWDHKADKDLLLAIIENGDLKSISWPAIAAKMQAKQYTFTHEACRQHFQKIRKESRTGGNSSSPAKGTSNGANKSMTTPRKSSKAHGASSFESINDDDDEKELTPSAKRKRTVKKEEGKENGEEQSAYLFKMEQGENAVIDLENDSIYEL